MFAIRSVTTEHTTRLQRSRPLASRRAAARRTTPVARRCATVRGSFRDDFSLSKQLSRCARCCACCRIVHQLYCAADRSRHVASSRGAPPSNLSPVRARSARTDRTRPIIVQDIRGRAIRRCERVDDNSRDGNNHTAGCAAVARVHRACAAVV